MATLKEKIDLVQSYINKNRQSISADTLKALETVVDGGKNYDKMSSQDDKDLVEKKLNNVYEKVQAKMTSQPEKKEESKASKAPAAKKEPKKTKSGSDRKKPDPASTVMGLAKQIMEKEGVSWAAARTKAAAHFRDKKKDGAAKPKSESKPKAEKKLVAKKEKISEKKKIARKPRVKKAAAAPKAEKKEAPKKEAPKKATKKKIARKSSSKVPQGKERDASRSAKHSGFRKTSTATNKRGGYYEYRENRTDKQNKRYPMLGDGGEMEYATGGMIKNQYDGRTAEDIWSSWTYDQRSHFLSDNYMICEIKPSQIDLIADSPYSAVIKMQTNVPNALNKHISRGQYATGGLFGGRSYPTGAAWHKEMKYRSGEKHEQSYERKKEPTNMRYNTNKMENDEMADGGFFGGRDYPEGAAWHKEMKYRSKEKHEKKYKRKRNPKNARYKKFNDGGQITKKESYDIGDRIKFVDPFRKEEKDGTVYQINELGTYIVNYGSGITAGVRGVDKKDILGAYPKVEAKKKRFGIFENGGDIQEVNQLEKRLNELNKLFSENANELGEYLYITDRLRELNAESMIPSDFDMVDNPEDFVMYSDKMALGGRPKSALMRDRAYKSNERWEQAYERKKEPTNPKYSHK
jgi:hypothetical protein